MSENLNKYLRIVQRYKDGEFGNDYSTLHDIFAAAGEPHLLDKMTLDDFRYIADHLPDLTKLIFLTENRSKE